MKIKKITLNNRKKSFEILTRQGVFEFPFSRLKYPHKVSGVFVDKELGREAFTVLYPLQKAQTIHMDQVLEYNQDQGYLREMLLYKLSLEAQKALKKFKTSRREIIRRLGTSPAQFYRLLDQTYYHKTIDQMVKLLSALDYRVDVVLKRAA